MNLKVSHLTFKMGNIIQYLNELRISKLNGAISRLLDAKAKGRAVGGCPCGSCWRVGAYGEARSNEANVRRPAGMQLHFAGSKLYRGNA
jgi:hypothetical protein